MDGFVQGDRDGCRRGITVFIEVYEQLIGLDAKALADRIDDPAVGLVRDDAFDLRDVDFTAAEGFLARRKHRSNGAFEGFFAVHS